MLKCLTFLKIKYRFIDIDILIFVFGNKFREMKDILPLLVSYQQKG